VLASSLRSQQLKLAFHDTDTDFLARKSRVSDVSGESESESVSASWNASLTTLGGHILVAYTVWTGSEHVPVFV